MIYSYIITYEEENGQLIDWLELTEEEAFEKGVELYKRGLWIYDFKRITYKETPQKTLKTVKIERYHDGEPSEVIYTTE